MKYQDWWLMNKEKKLVPELRFPEFRNDGDWEENEFEKYCESISSGRDIHSNKGEFILYGSTGVIGATETSSYSGEFILIARVGANAGLINRVAGRFGVTDNALVIDLKNKNTVNFFFFSIENIGLKKLVFGSGQPLITGGQLKSLSVKIPKSLKEQEKIANCLSSLGELIATQKNKLEALKDHKKGLLKNLFPQEGETVPGYRFPEFENDGDWAHTQLIDVADKKVKWSFTGGPFGSDLKTGDYKTTGIRIIQLQNIGDGDFKDDYKIYTSIEKADELLNCNIYSGEIILSKMGDPVGRACIIPANLERCVMASDGIRLVVDEKRHSKYFIYSLINSIQVRENIESKATGSTRKRIGLDELKQILLALPKNPNEQQKIASCFSTLDELIAAQAKRIEQLQLHKKGLMQGLFPNPS